MNFSLNAKLSCVTKLSWSDLENNLWRVYENFQAGYYPDMIQGDTRLHLTIKSNQLADTKPFYEIIIDRDVDRIIMQSVRVANTLIEHHEQVGCLPAPDFITIMEKCKVEGGVYNLLTPDISLYMECYHNELPVFNMGVYGINQYLSKLWEVDKLKHASDLAYELCMHPDHTFEEFVGRREIKNVKIEKYLPSLEAKHPGLIKELKDWHCRVTGSKLLDQERYMRSSLMELCYLSTKPQLMAILGEEWVERVLVRAVDTAEANDFRITRGILPVEEYANRFDALLAERKQWLVERGNERDAAMDSA